jgi:hypothetical protein
MFVSNLSLEYKNYLKVPCDKPSYLYIYIYQGIYAVQLNLITSWYCLQLGQKAVNIQGILRGLFEIALKNRAFKVKNKLFGKKLHF